jgi:hypothetical protein
MRRVGRPGLAPLQIVRDSVPTLRRAAESPACGARSRACATLRSASSTSPAATTSSPSDGGSCQMVMAPLAVQSFAPYPQSEQQNVGLDRLVTLQHVLAHKGVPERVRAEGVEPSLCPRSGRRNGCDLRNNMSCDSLRFPWFVPKCAQNVPTGSGSTAPTKRASNSDRRATRALARHPAWVAGRHLSYGVPSPPRRLNVNRLRFFRHSAIIGASWEDCELAGNPAIKHP